MTTRPVLLRIASLASAMGGALALSIITPGIQAAAADEATATLSVESDPPGARVQVDGKPRGETPLTLSDLAAGEHCVTVTKPGHLDNSRFVTLPAGEAVALRVALTPNPAATATRPAEEPGPSASATRTPAPAHRKGGGTHGLDIAMPAAAGAGFAAAWLTSKDQTATASVPWAAKGRPPVPGTVSASPTPALMAVTEVVFTSEGARDPDGDALTYAWDFGDGSGGSGSPARHVYATTGTLTARLGISDGTYGVTGSSASVTVKDLTGIWSGSIPGSRMQITQVGASLSGALANPLPRHDAFRFFHVEGSATDSRRVSVGFHQMGHGYYLGAGTECFLDASLDVCVGTLREWWLVDGVGLRSERPCTWTRESP